jgi:hypothetical protein
VTGCLDIQQDLFNTDDGVTGYLLVPLMKNRNCGDRVTGCSAKPPINSGFTIGDAKLTENPSGIDLTNTPSPRQLYGQSPDIEILLATIPPRLSANHAALLTCHVMRQAGGPGPLLDWEVRQANRYSEVFPKWTYQDQDHCAAFDLLIWQRAENIKSTSRWNATREIMELLEGLEEVANSLKETNL